MLVSGYEVVEGADLSGARLPGANFQGAVLREVRLHDADLRGANFSSTELFFTSFLRADVRCADFTGTSFEYVYRQSTDAVDVGPSFESAIYDELTVWPDGRPPEGAIFHVANPTDR